MASSKISVIPFRTQSPTFPLTISSEQISQYAEITALISGLESQQKELRSLLLKMHAAGAEQEETSPYLLSFVEQERRTIDWKSQALALAAKVYGSDGVSVWQEEVERATPVTSITQIRMKPNSVFAAGLTPTQTVVSERRPQ